MKNNHLTVLLCALGIAILLGATVFVVGMQLGKKDQNNTETVSDQTTTINTDDATPDDNTLPTEDTASATTDDSTANPTIDTTTPQDSSDTPTETDQEIPAELVIPEDADALEALLPEGANLSYYWYAKMNDDEYNEYAIVYTLDGEVKVTALGVDQNQYKPLWDETIPGSSVNYQNVRIEDLNSDGTIDIAVQTDNFMNIYQYSDDKPVVFTLNGGTHAGENTEITLGTPLVASVELDDTNDNGKNEIIYVSAPDDAGNVEKEIYEWDGTLYSYLETITVAPESPTE